MRLKEKNLLQTFAATLKKFSAQGAKKVEYGMCVYVHESDAADTQAEASLSSKP